MNRAIILIDDAEDDRDRAADCVEQSGRRYGFVALMQDVDRALDLVRRHIFSAVIFPGRTRRGRPVRDPEPGIDDTAVLTFQVPAPRVVASRPAPHTAEWVQHLINENAALIPRVEGYREGYVDGFVDCLTIKGQGPS